MDIVYYVEENTEIKSYGIYEYFSREKNAQRKTFGAISENKYLFSVDIFDHYSAWDEMRQDLGDFSIWFSPYGKKEKYNKLDIGISNSESNKHVTIFQLECIIGILNELKRYCKDKGEEFEVYIPSYCLKDKEGICTKDLDLLINEITYHINEITHDIDEMQNEEEKSKGIKNLKIFKMFKKEKSKSK